MLADARVRLLMIATVAAAMLVVGLVAVRNGSPAGPTAGPAAAPVACTELRVVLVPGNGQVGTGEGAVLSRFLGRMTAFAGGRSIDKVVLASTTRPTSVLGAGVSAAAKVTAVRTARIRSWAGNLDPVTSRIVRAVAQAAQECPNRPVVLAGYAQGAGALHRALARLASGTLAPQIAGAVLYSDPFRARTTKAVSPIRPVVPGVLQVRGPRAFDVPRSGTSVTTYSICAKGDIVCAFGNQKVGTGIAVHNRYPRASATLFDSPARGIGAVLAGIPRVSAAPATITAPAGVPLRRAVPFTILSSMRSKVSVTLAPGSGPLPAGVRLGSAGTLVGTPTTPGTTELLFRIVNRSAAKYGLPVTGRVSVQIDPATRTRTAVGGDTVCTILATGRLWCWGDNAYGQIGDGTKVARSRPVAIGTSTSWAEVATSGTHTCALTTTGSLSCWGSNAFGQLGDATGTSRVKPTVMPAPGGAWESISVNTFNTCAITRAGVLYCWGSNDWRQIGDGTTTRAQRPRSLGPGWAQVSVGQWSTCGLKDAGDLYCWGANDFGQIGDGTRTTRDRPVRIGASTVWSGVSVGAMHACATAAAGSIFCWGLNSSGQLGDGTTSRRPSPVAVLGGNVWQSVSVGDQFSCGVRFDGAVWCWGNGRLGARGSAVRSASAVPVAVSGGFRGSRISAGWSHVCAESASQVGALSCWGVNYRGQLGNGQNTLRTVPVAVSFPASAR